MLPAGFTMAHTTRGKPDLITALPVNCHDGHCDDCDCVELNSRPIMKISYGLYNRFESPALPPPSFESGWARFLGGIAYSSCKANEDACAELRRQMHDS